MNLGKFIEIFWLGIIAAVLIYAMYNGDMATIDKILLVALGLFKGIESVSKLRE